MNLEKSTALADSCALEMLESGPMHMAILDANGVILETNAAWRNFARNNGMADDASCIGINYLELCDAADCRDARAMADGIRAVLQGVQTEFEAVYPCHSPCEKRWFLARVHQLSGATEGKALVSLDDVTRLKLAEEQLVQAQQRAEATAAAITKRERFISKIADHMPGMVGYWDRELRCCFANRAYQEWFGKPPEAMLGITLQELMGERLFALSEPNVRRALAGEKLQFERTLTKPDGSVGYTLAHYIPDINARGEVVGFFVQANDVTPLKKAEFELKLAASVYENTHEGIFVTDAQGTILSVNPAFTKITGYTAAEAVGQNPRLLQSHHHDQVFYAAMWQALLATGNWSGEVWNRHKDGVVFLEQQTITRIATLPGEPVRYLSVFHDITELRRRDEKIRHLAFYDLLTDLPNRSLLMDRLEHQIALAQREQCDLVLMFLDLDRFKIVNDTLGHDIGDDLLKTVAQKLMAQVRKSDTVARVGGDEFVVLLGEPASHDEVAQIANLLIAVANEPLEFCEQAQVGVSIGIAIYPQDGSSPSELMKNADKAMYAAKQAGKNTYRFCTPPKLQPREMAAASGDKH